MSESAFNILETINAAFTVPAEDRPAGFGYFVIYSSPEKYDEMVRFYQIILGGQATTAPDGLEAVQIGDASQSQVLIVKRPDLPKPSLPMMPGILHLAWFYNSLAELMYVYRIARDHGYKTDEVLNSGVLLQIYVYDPEGNGIEIGVDVHDTSAATQRAMVNTDGKRMPEFMKLWRYDPEKILKMMEAGISDQDIFSHETYHQLVASGRF